MRWMLVVVLSCVVCPVTFGQQDSDSHDRRPPGSDGRGPAFWRQGGRWGVPDEEEMARIQKFMKEHSPRRWEALTKLNADQQQRLKQIMVRRFRLLELIKTNNDDALYNLRVKRLEVEDDIFGLTRDLRNATGTKDVEVRQKLKDAIGQLVDLGIQEHQAKIDRWQKMIADEKLAMDREKQDREALIKKHLRNAEKESGNLGDDVAATQDSDTPATTQSADANANQ